MSNDEQQVSQGALPQSPQPDEEASLELPSGPPGDLPDDLSTSSSPLLQEQEHNPAVQALAPSYYPDLTMDMGNSLGYSQSIQHHSISMPQPTQSLLQLRRERQRQLREKHQSRRQRRDFFFALLRRERPSSLIEAASAPPQETLSALPLAQEDEKLAVSGLSSLDVALAGSGARPIQDSAELQRVKVARTSSLLSGAFIVSSILGLLQTFLFTAIFGSSLSGEAYLQAYLIPNLIYTVIAGGALSSAFIPVFSFYAAQDKNEKVAWHIASSALNISVIAMILLSIMALFAAPIIVPLYSRPDEVGLIVTLTRIMLLQAIVLGSGVIVGSVLNTKQNFTRTALGTVLYNVGLNLGLLPGFVLMLHARSSSPSDIAVYAATWGVVLGAILQVGVQIPGLFKIKMRYTFVFDWRHPGVVQIARQMVPRVINSVMLSFSTMVDRFLLSLLRGGLLNPYLQAFSILLLPVSLFGSSISTAAFPTLAGYAARKRFERVRSIITETLRDILFLTIPSGVGLMVLSFPVVQSLLEHGNFDLSATQFAAIVLLFFALGLPGLAAVEILTRSFYALQDSKTPVAISVVQFLLKIALSFLLINLAVLGVKWGMGGLAFSTSLSATLEALVLFFLLSRRIGGFDIRALLHFIGQVLLASGVMAVILLLLRMGLDHLIDTTSAPRLLVPGIFLALLKLLLEVSTGATAFLIVARLLRIKEMHSGLAGRVLKFLKIPWF